uniref:Uncharacterized protein n=1 Tax=Ascaris lumbricoides TaxID=6252 RepID=A0A9J2PK52_ASCLU
MTSSVDTKVLGSDERHVENTALTADSSAPEEGNESREASTRGRRTAASKCVWAPLMGKRGKHLEDYISDEDYTPDRRSTSARGGSVRKRGRTRKSVSTTSDGQSAAKSVPATTEQGSSSVMPEQGSSSLTPESQQRSLKKYSAGGNVTAGDNIQEEAEWDSEGEEITYNLDEEFEDDNDIEMGPMRKMAPAPTRRTIRAGRTLIADGARGDVRAAPVPLTGSRPSVALGGAGMLAGKAPDISKATSIIRKIYTAQIPPRADDQPPLKVVRMTPSAQNIQQKYAFVKNSAGQLCRVMKAAAVPQTGIRNVAAYNIASANVSSKVARGSDIEPELREKMSKRVVAGDSVAEYNAIIDALHAELARVIEDRKKVVVNNRELIDQMQLAHATAVDIRESRIRQLERQVDILQAKLQNHLRKEQALLLGNDSHSQPAGNSGSADGRQMKIDMGMNGSRAVGKHDDTAVTQTNPLSKDRSGPPVLGSERVAMRTMEQLKQDVDDDDLDEIDEEEEGDFDELE